MATDKTISPREITRPSDIKIGEAFTNGDALFRCTDIGTRTIIAIRIDSAVIQSSDGSSRTENPRNEKFLQDGPTYFRNESVFDEDCMDAGMMFFVPEADVNAWDAKEWERTREGELDA